MAKEDRAVQITEAEHADEGDDDAPELFGTETMAELCARQGRIAQAVAIYRRLIGAATDDERRARFAVRCQGLERARAHAVDLQPAPPPTAPVVAEPHHLPLVVTQPVRSGQVVYAPKSDLIVLAAVNSGAQVVADGNIHVYGSLRGRAMAGAQGCAAARIFCQRLEPELLAINGTYLCPEDIPRPCLGRPAQIFLRDGRCEVSPLY